MTDHWYPRIDIGEGKHSVAADGDDDTEPDPEYVHADTVDTETKERRRDGGNDEHNAVGIEPRFMLYKLTQFTQSEVITVCKCNIAPSVQAPKVSSIYHTKSCAKISSPKD